MERKRLRRRRRRCSRKCVGVKLAGKAESGQPTPEHAGLTGSAGCTGLQQGAAGFYEVVGDRDIVGMPTPSASSCGVRGSVTEFVFPPMYSGPFASRRSGSRPFPCFGGDFMLYDREDRMSRPTFLREYDIEGSTEKRARAEGLPWPPYVVLGGRVYYSRRLVARWFEQQAGVHRTSVVEASDADEFCQAGQEAEAGVND
jgi:hypothetical protein